MTEAQYIGDTKAVFEAAYDPVLYDAIEDEVLECFEDGRLERGPNGFPPPQNFRWRSWDPSALTQSRRATAKPAEPLSEEAKAMQDKLVHAQAQDDVVGAPGSFVLA